LIFNFGIHVFISNMEKFWMFILQLCWTHSSKHFCRLCAVMSSAYGADFSFSFWSVAIALKFLVSLQDLPAPCWMSGESAPSLLCSWSEGECFHEVKRITCRFLDAFYLVGEITISYYFLGNFYQEWILSFVKFFYGLIQSYFSSLNLVNVATDFWILN
jgi:hypothetical protein